MHNILVTGSSGQLGSEIRAISSKYPQYLFTFAERSDLDLSDLDSIEPFFQDKKFDFLINCAAYTAVDKAEVEPELADIVNHQAVEILARIAKERSISLVHISTDYVFDGRNCRPYIESDQTNQGNKYGKTKYLGEQAIRLIAPANSVIIRTSWVYSHFGNNFLKTMLRLSRERDELKIIYDQIGTPTCARDLAITILEIIPQLKNSSPEIYHFSNEGVASWYDFAKAIFEYSEIKCKVIPVTTAQYPLPAIRPHYSLLNKDKIKNDFGIKISFWRDSLKGYLLLNSLK